MNGSRTEPVEPSDGDLAEYGRALLRFRWLLLLCCVVGLAGAYLWTTQQTPIYRSVATIEYVPNPMRPLGNDVEDVADPVGDYLSTRELLETQNRVMASRNVVTRVVERLGLEANAGFFGEDEAGFEARDIDTAVDVLRGRIMIEPVTNTRLADVTVRDPSPRRAKLIADTLVDVFIEKSLEDRLASTVKALDWLVEQLDKLRTELEESELSLHEFKEQHNVLSVSMEDRQNIVAHEMGSLSAAISTIQQERIRQEAHVDRLRTVQERNLPVDGDDGGADVIAQLRNRLREKTAELERLSVRYGPEHPEMNALTTEVANLREQITLELNGMVEAGRARLAETRQIERGLRGALQRNQEAGMELNLREIEYQRLVRERENREKLYQHVLERATETNLTRMLNTSHVRPVDAGTTERDPVSPNFASSLAGGSLVGFLLGVMLALALQRFDQRIRGPAQVEATGVTVLGMLPHMESEGAEGRKRRAESLPLRERDRFVHLNPMSSVAESCRTIRTNLTFMSAHRNLGAFLVTSPTPREGKTTVASNLAISLAQSGLRVLLVDTDLRRPRLHRSFSVESGVGITNFLVGDGSFSDTLVDTEVDNLSLAICGPIPPNPSELLHTKRFGEFIRTARSQFDRVIFDSPPLGAVSDAAVIAPQLDGALLVVKAGQTTRDGLRSCIRQLGDVEANLLGTVVNDIDASAGGTRYGTYYHYYRREGYYQDEDADVTKGAA